MVQAMGNKNVLMVVDIGNTNIIFGIFEGDVLTGTYRMTTKFPRTSDEYGLFIQDVLRERKLAADRLRGIIISSVVPKIMYSFESAIKKYTSVQPLIVGVGIRTGIRITTINPTELGADRIVDAVGGYEIYGGPLIVIDFGTATTYDVITEDGTFMAGVIAPGIQSCANALWSDTAKLPEIEIKKPSSVLARETISSMQAGLVFGYIGQSEYIIRKIKKELGQEDIQVVATGGLGKLIADATEEINVYDRDLTLKGLKLIFEKNMRG